MDNSAYFSHVDSRDARCLGLVEQTALRQLDNIVVNAEWVKKQDGPFYCASCLSEVVVRKCTEKIDHFAHKARHSPTAKGEQRATIHNRCRDELCTFLNSKYPEGNWKAERPIPANDTRGFKELIPDISGRINNTPVAIEVQLSPYTINRIANRTTQYYERGIAVLWVVPLTKELGNEPFRPRHFEKYLHSLYYGRVYYWHNGQKWLVERAGTLGSRGIEGSLLKVVSVNFFRFMKKGKKSAAGPAAVWM